MTPKESLEHNIWQVLAKQPYVQETKIHLESQFKENSRPCFTAEITSLI